MAKNFEVGVKITADSKGLVGESRTAKEAIGGIGDAARKATGDSAAFTNQTQQQSAATGQAAISLGGLKTGLIAAAGAYVSLGAAIAGGKAIIDAALAQDRLNNTLKVGTGSAEAAAKEIAFLRQESEKLGLQFATTSQQYAKLSAAAAGTTLQGQATRDIFLGIAKASTVLGLSADQTGGALLAIEQMISKGNVSAEELRGQLGERLPGAFQMAARAMGVTTQELDKMLQKGEVTATRLLPALAIELEKTFGAQAQEAAQGLGAKINRLDNAFTDLKIAIGNTGLLDLLSNGIVLATRFVDALSGAKVLSAVDAQKQKIAEMRTELESLGNRKHIPLIGDLIFDKKQADLLSQRIDDAIGDLQRLEKEAAQATGKSGAVAPGTKPALPDSLVKELEKQTSAREKAAEAAAKQAQQAVESSNRIIASLKLETEQIGLNAIQKRMMSAAAEAAKAPTKELANEIMAAAAAWGYAAQQQENLQVAEKERIEGLKAIEQAEKAAARASEEAARKSAAEWNQLWGGVETTAKTAFIQFAAHGKSAMESIGESIKIAILDVLYQLTIRKWVINIGASLSGFGGSGMAMAGDMGGGALGNALSIGSIGTNIASMFKSGFGTSSLVRSGLGFLGGSFGAGASGAASAGVFGAGGLPFLGGAGTALGGAGTGAAAAATEFGAMASMGASFASIAGPAIAIAAVDQITRLLAGDKLIGGGVGKVLNYVPVLGPLLNGLFGRGPMKQQGTLLTGEIGAEGFESGYLQTRFKAKGGLFRSDKIDYARVDAVTGEVWTDNNKLLDFAKDLSKTGKELFGLINDTTKQTSSSLRQIGQDLGVSTEGIDNFKHSISLLSEKSKMLTEEQIGEEIQKITDGLAHSLLPQVDDLAKRGETALQTVSRLGVEFTSLVDAATVLLGKSAADARSMVLGTSFDDRTGFVDKIGGVDALGQLTQLFSANFLSAAERLAPAKEKLNADLVELGLSADLTREGFRGLVQSFGDVNGVSADMLASLLKLMPAFLDVRAAQDQLAISAKNLQVRLLETQGNSGAALQLRRDMELDAADPSQRGTLREIYAAEDAAARFARVMDVLNTAQQKNIEIANQKYGLETQLLQLQGNTAELRKRELDALDPSNRALQERVFALQDEQAIAREKTGLETQLLQLQGNTAELRKRELDALDPTNRSLQQYIWTLEDQQTAMQKAQQSIETARSNAGSALSVLQKSVDEERKGVETHIANITASVGKLRDLSGALQNTLGRMTIAVSESDQRAAAQAQITAALTIARASGSLPETDSLRQALDTVAQPSEDLFGSFTDYMRDFARTAADINALDALAQNQIGAQEQSLAVEKSQLTYLDGLLTTAQEQIDAINGVDTSIKSLGAALSGFQAAVTSVSVAKSDAAIIAAGGAGSSAAAIAAATNIDPPPPPPPATIAAPVITPAPVGILGGAGNPAYSGRDIVSFLTSGVTPEQGLAKALETGVSAKQIESAFAGRQGYTLSNIRDFVISKGLVPGFANGGLHSGGLRIVGERGPELEYTGPSWIVNNNDSKRLLDFSEVVAELKALRAEMAQITKNTHATADLLDNVSAGGGAMLVEIAS